MIQVVRSVIGNILLSFIKISVNKVFKKKKKIYVFNDLNNINQMS